MSENTNDLKERLSLEIFNLIEREPDRPDPSILTKDRDLEEVMCLWELIEKDNILEDPRAKDACARGRLRRSFKKAVEEEPEIFEQGEDYEYLDDLHYEVLEFETSEAYHYYELAKLLQSPTVDAWLKNLKKDLDIIDKVKLTNKNLDRLKLRERTRQEKEKKEQKTNQKNILPTINTIEKLSQIIIEGFEEAEKNKDDKNLFRWGIALSVPTDLYVPTALALMKLEFRGDVKLANVKYKEYRYKHFTFFLICDHNTVSKIKLLWIDKQQLKENYKAAADAFSK